MADSKQVQQGIPKQSPGATAVAEPDPKPEPKPDPPQLIGVDKDFLAEILRAQQRTSEMIASFLAAQQAQPGQPSGVSMAHVYPTARPTIQGSMPSSYVVWLGPEPPAGGEICFRARGVVRVITDNETEYPSVDGHGYGKAKIVKGTTVKARTTDYVDAGYTSVEFNRRCPASHKYAGRLYAEIECAEHAAYLYVSAPDGQGRTHEHQPLFRFFLHPTLVAKYEALKRSRFASRASEQAEVEWVVNRGVDMPIE